MVPRRIAFAFLLIVSGFSGVRPAQTQTLIFDNFDNVELGASISGRAPVINTINGNTWIAPVSINFLGNGDGALTANTSTNASASIDLGAGYLSANSAVYNLSLDITQPSTNPTTGWIAFGFASGGNTANQLVDNNGAPWMLYRRNGEVRVYAGGGISNFLLSASATTGTVHTFSLQLNTAPTDWTLDAFIDGNQLDLNGGGAGLTYTYSGNPTGSRYAQMAASNQGGTGGTVDNFLLTAVPEPSLVALVTLGLSFLVMRRRRHQAV